MTCIWFVLCALLTFESVVGNESGQPYDYQEPGNYDLTDGPPDPADVLYPGQAKKRGENHPKMPKTHQA